MIFPGLFGSGYGLYLLFSLPALLLGFWAQFKVKGAFDKFSRVRTFTGVTGSEVARRILDNNGLHDVKVEQVGGMLSDHYDPVSRTLRLSAGVYNSPSVAAAGIAAHESGHAIQHAQHYFPLKVRTAIVPAVQIGSWLGPIIFIAGLALLGTQVAWAGLILFALTAVFALVTLPVELDASNRAKAILATSGMIYNSEAEGVNKVLNAAAWTYVAAAVQAVSTVLYYLFLLSGRSRD